MSLAEPTKRLPAETRQKLLDVAADIILEKGFVGFTLETVARAAGVSKGGLLHHFPSKQHLIDALVVDLHEQFLERWREKVNQDSIEQGKLTRAYLHVAIQHRNDKAAKICKIIAVEDRQNSTMRSLWREFLTSLINSDHPEGVDPVTLAIVQLATDGLWLADLEGILDGSSPLFQEIVARLESMTRPG